ncbi:MAG TPA: hypothetical protein VLE69_01460 [Candidatus Saccharimonadales bacterium]|nr:hypothetical protein [Candidatus Saccharimonadales bacterium]
MSDRLATDLQAGELFEAIQTDAFVFGENMGQHHLWNLGSVVLPESVTKRCAIEPDRVEGYYGLVSSPTDPTVMESYRGINFLWSDATHRERTTDHIQYRAVKAPSGIVAVEKHFLAEPIEAQVLDSSQQLAQLEAEIAEGLVVPDLQDDMLGFIGLASKRARLNFEENDQRRKTAQQFAREIGMTDVYYDEAEALLEFITSQHPN